MSDSEEDDDQVIETYNVYLNRGPEDKTYLLRHPLRPAYKPLPDPDKARLKPENKVLQLQYDMLKKDYEDGSHIEMNMPHGISDRERKKLEEEMRYQKYESTRVVSRGRSYCMGIIDREEMEVTLVPLAGVLEMRPVVQTGFKNASLLVEDIPDPEAERLKREAEAKAKSKPQRVEVENLKKQSYSRSNETSKQETYSMLKAKVEQEPYVDLHCFGRDSVIAASVYNKELKYQLNDLEPFGGDDDDEEEEEEEEDSENNEMELEEEDDDDPSKPIQFSPKKKRRKQQKSKLKDEVKLIDSLTAFSENSSNYLDKLAPSLRDVELLSGDGRTKTITYTFDEQLKQKLITLGVARFEELVPPATLQSQQRNNKRVLDILPSFGILVRGLWIIKSDICFQEKFGMVVDGANKSLMARKAALRDLILGLINKSPKGTLKKEDITKLIKSVQASQIREAFTTICEHDRETKVWKLKKSDGHKFIKQHTDLVQAQTALLNELMRKALILLGMDPKEALANAKS